MLQNHRAKSKLTTDEPGRQQLPGAEQGFGLFEKGSSIWLMCVLTEMCESDATGNQEKVERLSGKNSCQTREQQKKKKQLWWKKLFGLFAS